MHVVVQVSRDSSVAMVQGIIEADEGYGVVGGEVAKVAFSLGFWPLSPMSPITPPQAGGAEAAWGASDWDVDVISNVSNNLCVQSIRQPGLLDVWRTLLGSDDSSALTIQAYPALCGAPYGRIRKGFPGGVVRPELLTRSPNPSNE